MTRLTTILTTLRDRFLTGSSTGSFHTQSNDRFPAPSPTGAGTSRTGSPRGSSTTGTTHHHPITNHPKDHPMTSDQDTCDDTITYVDALPETDSYPVGAKTAILAAADHVHVRGSDRCVKRRMGPLCGWADGRHQGPALPDEHPDPFIAAIERATGRNGARLLEQLHAQGLTVVTVQVEDPRMCQAPVDVLDPIDTGCVVCGRDNRHGTHTALEAGGHLSHPFTVRTDLEAGA